MVDNDPPEMGVTSITLPPEKLALTYDDMAVALSLTVGALRIMVHRKQIPYTKLGSRVRFIPKDIEAWLKRRSHRASG